MRQKKNTLMEFIELELHKWLRGVEKAGLLNFLWVPHYHRAPLTIFVIKQLLCMVHDGCLCLEEPIPITDHLIHRITQLPCKREDPANISNGKSDDLAIVEAMKEKFNQEKKERGYVISSINSVVVRVVKLILVGKVIRKCHVDEFSAPVVALSV